MSIGDTPMATAVSSPEKGKLLTPRPPLKPHRQDGTNLCQASMPASVQRLMRSRALSGRPTDPSEWSKSPASTLHSRRRSSSNVIGAAYSSSSCYCRNNITDSGGGSSNRTSRSNSSAVDHKRKEMPATQEDVRERGSNSGHIDQRTPQQQGEVESNHICDTGATQLYDSASTASDKDTRSSSRFARAECDQIFYVRLTQPSLRARPRRRLQDALRFATHATAHPTSATTTNCANSVTTDDDVQPAVLAESTSTMIKSGMMSKSEHRVPDTESIDKECAAEASGAAVIDPYNHTKRLPQPRHNDSPGRTSNDTVDERVAAAVRATGSVASTEHCTANALTVRETMTADVSSLSVIGVCETSSSISGVSAMMASIADCKLVPGEVVFPGVATSSTSIPTDPSLLASATSKHDAAVDDGFDSGVLALRDETYGKLSPFTQKENLSSRWSSYVVSGDISFFDGDTKDIEIERLVGIGGSGLVFRGYYGARRLPVAVKMFILPSSDVSHQDYVRESLTDVAFYVLANQLSDHGLCVTCRAHDFVVSSRPPRGLSRESIAMAMQRQTASSVHTGREEKDNTTASGGGGGETKFCYFVTDLVDGELGRFLTSSDDDYDPCYDVLKNSSLRDGELFQLLYFQLAARYVFDWTLLDFMLNGQLRGDNVGYRYLSCDHQRTGSKRTSMDSNRIDAADNTRQDMSTGVDCMRRSYAGILICYQTRPDSPPRYLRFDAHESHKQEDTAYKNHVNCRGGVPRASDPLRFIYFLDLGQGKQPYVRQLTERKLIGNTVIESCVVDDGFGRYWPLDELYCRDIDVSGELSSQVRAWGAQLRLRTEEEVWSAMEELFELYAPHYGSGTPLPMDLRTHLVLQWTHAAVHELRRKHIYSAHGSSNATKV